LSTMRKRFELRSTFYLLVILSSFVGIGIAGYWYYTVQKEEGKQGSFAELSTVADLKVNEIARWRRERLADAYSIMDIPFIASFVQRCFEGSSQPGPAKEVLKWMNTYMNRFDYFSISLLDLDGGMRLSVPDLQQPDDHLREHISETAQTGIPVLCDLERSENVNNIHLNLTIPIHLSTDEKEATVPVGVVLIRIDPYKFLYPLIQSWPTPSRTAETMLVRREGDEIVFLNKLRHVENQPLSLRRQVNRTKKPCAATGEGQEGVTECVDYRGASVLAIVRRIPDTPWLLIAKIDADEVYAPLRERALLLTFIVALLVAGAGVTVGLIWSYQRSRLLKEARDSLEHRVRERTTDLVEMNELLKMEVEMRERAENECRAVTGRLADTEESERRRLARELHDRVGQNLTAINFNLAAVSNLLPAESSAEAMKRLEDSLKLVNDTVTCVRGMMVDLRPPLLDDYGLSAVLPWYCREFSERSGIPTAVKCGEQTPRLPLPAESALFRITQEALTNVMRHARASQVTVELDTTDEAVRLSIIDNGVGFDPEATFSPQTKRSSWGMLSMRERAEMVGGRLQVSSTPGGGTRIVVEVKR
jgi:signal transduction histidine kinase